MVETHRNKGPVNYLLNFVNMPAQRRKFGRFTAICEGVS